MEIVREHEQEIRELMLLVQGYSLPASTALLIEYMEWRQK